MSLRSGILARMRSSLVRSGLGRRSTEIKELYSHFCDGKRLGFFGDCAPKKWPLRGSRAGAVEVKGE